VTTLGLRSRNDERVTQLLPFHCAGPRNFIGRNVPEEHSPKRKIEPKTPVTKVTGDRHKFICFAD
jgi:hypothetical protein